MLELNGYKTNNELLLINNNFNQCQNNYERIMTNNESEPNTTSIDFKYEHTCNILSYRNCHGENAESIFMYLKSKPKVIETKKRNRPPKSKYCLNKNCKHCQRIVEKVDQDLMTYALNNTPSFQTRRKDESSDSENVTKAINKHQKGIKPETLSHLMEIDQPCEKNVIIGKERVFPNTTNTQSQSSEHESCIKYKNCIKIDCNLLLFIYK